MRDKDELYREYIECYKQGKSLSKLKSVDETFQVLKLKRGLPVKYIKINNPLDLPRDINCFGENGNDGLYMTQKGFYLIPNDFNNKIISFVIRGLQKQYIDMHGMSNRKPLFGWSTFTNFKKNKPIIVTEGAKDCIVLQTVYPYVLATLTSGLSSYNVQIIKAMTNKVILAYDEDRTGSTSTPEDIKRLSNQGIQVQVIKPKGKDFGKMYNNLEEVKNIVFNKVNKFSKLGVIV